MDQPLFFHSSSDSLFWIEAYYQQSNPSQRNAAVKGIQHPGEIKTSKMKTKYRVLATSKSSREKIMKNLFPVCSNLLQIQPSQLYQMLYQSPQKRKVRSRHVDKDVLSLWLTHHIQRSANLHLLKIMLRTLTRILFRILTQNFISTY